MIQQLKLASSKDEYESSSQNIQATKRNSHNESESSILLINADKLDFSSSRSPTTQRRMKSQSVDTIDVSSSKINSQRKIDSRPKLQIDDSPELSPIKEDKSCSQIGSPNRSPVTGKEKRKTIIHRKILYFDKESMFILVLVKL